MGLLGRIFGSKKAIEEGAALINKVTDHAASGIDKAFYTQEEKADDIKENKELKIRLLEAFKPYELVLRLISIIIISVYSLMVFITFLASFIVNVDKQIEILEGRYGIAFVSVVVFYFGNLIAKKLRSPK